MKKKLIIVLIIITVIVGFWAFYECFLSNYLLQSKFALKTPIATAQGDKFNYTWETKEYGPFIGTCISYKIYHFEGNRWQKVMKCGGGYANDQNIEISSAYDDKNIIVYKVWQCRHESVDALYLLVDKSSNKGIDLGFKLGYAYSDMTPEQIRKDGVLNIAKAFIFNYSVPKDDYYKNAFDKVKQVFQEK